MPSKPVDQYDLETEVLPYLSGVEGSNGHWTAWCNCHDDEGTSVKGLSLSHERGKNLGRCHSPHCGATLSQVIDVIEGSPNGDEPDIRVREKRTTKAVVDSSNGAGGMKWWCEKTGVPRKIWEDLGCYEHESGVQFTFTGTEAIKVRKPPKDVYWTPKNAPNPPLWPYPPDKCPKHVTVVEGESDCGTAHAGGLPYAFAITKGAGTELGENVFEALAARGVEEVTLCGDADDSGQAFLAKAARNAVSAGLTVNSIRLEEILDPLAGLSDLNDVWHETGHSKRLFQQIIKRATHRVASRYLTLSPTVLEEEAKKKMEWFIPNLLAPGDKFLISGPQKSYKTWCALELIRCLALKQAFMCRDEWIPSRARKVLLVEEEGSRQAWAKRVRRLKLGKSRNAHFLHRIGFRFTDPESVSELIGLIRQEHFDVVIFDPLQRMIPGVNENDAAATGIVWDEIMRMQIAFPHLACGILMHANKTETLTWESTRGSSRHAGEVDLGIFLQRDPTTDDSVQVNIDGRDIPHYLGTGETYSARVKISKDGEHPFFAMDATEIHLKVSTRQVQAAVNVDKVYLAVCDGNDTRTKIMKASGLADNSVIKYLKQLVEEGKVVEQEQGEGKPKLYTSKEGQ